MKITKKQPFGRIIKYKKKDGKIWAYHATKGWRVSREVN